MSTLGIDLLVLGGTGFLGRRVAAAALAQGMQVEVASRSHGGDLTAPGTLGEILKRLRPKSLVNCAAHTGGLSYVRDHPAEVLDDNARIVLQTYREVAEFSPHSTIVNPIANCAYPGFSEIQREEEWEDGAPHPSVLAFASTRRLMYATALASFHQYGVRSVNWLVPNLYGPGGAMDPNRTHALNGIALRMIRAQRAGEDTFLLWGTGNARREWCYVDDAAALLIDRICEEDICRILPLNMAQNQSHSMLDLTRLVASTIDFDGEITTDPSTSDGAQCKQLDDTRFRQHYPTFEFTSIDKGIIQMVDDYRERERAVGC